MTIHLIVGTAGHIDHGKTALVKALTGVDADRLPEEKSRGMTIDLGFAFLALDDLRLGIVDVPGHDRFIRNMLSGALAVDVAMLVIAATESIKPQTREHLEILKHTGIEQGVVVLTKCDLVDAAWIPLVEEEVHELTTHSFLRSAPLLRVSATTGTGLSELRRALAEASRRAADSSRRALVDAPFCLGVDRAFSIAGHGTVVTGSVASGRLRVGDIVTIAPHGTRARVRSLQSYGAPLEEVQRGQRAAINLAGVPLEKIRRGDVLAQHGFVSTSRCLGARLSLGPEHRSKPRRNLPVRVHIGTAEMPATLRYLARPRQGLDSAGEEIVAELRLSEPVACVAGQPLVIRSQCAAVTLGGGRVLDPELRPRARWSATDLAHLQQLASSDAAERVSAAVYLLGMDGFDERSVARRAGVNPPPSTLIDECVRQGRLERFQLAGGRHFYLHTDVVAQLMNRIEQLLEKQHQRNRMRAAFPRSVLQKLFDSTAGAVLQEKVVERMEQAGRLVTMPAGIALPGYAPQLSKRQRRQYTRIIRLHQEAGCAPPTGDRLISGVNADREAVPKLLELAVAEGHLVRVCAAWCLHWEIERHVLRTLRDHFGRAAFTVSDLRDRLHTSRKYLVPLCEYLDRIGFTERDGDLRTIIAPEAARREECCS